MTTHNLREHLLWLTHTALPPTLPDYCNNTAIPDTFISASADFNQTRNDIDTFEPQKDEEESLLLLENVQTQPLTVVEKEVVQRGDDMAKLKLGSSSAKKQLISRQAIPYSSPLSHHTEIGQRPAPEANTYTLHGSDGNKDTSPPNQLSSPSNVETWDEGQILWNEGAASRPEPPARRKRRSPDLEGELVPGTADFDVAEYLDIDALPLPSTIRGLLPPPKKQKTFVDQTVSRGDSKVVEEITKAKHDSENQTSIAQSSPLKPRQPVAVQNSSPAATIKQTPQPARYDSLASTSKRAKKKRVVIDSEDEEYASAESYVQPLSPTLRKGAKPDSKPVESTNTDHPNVIAKSPQPKSEQPSRNRPINNRGQERPKSGHSLSRSSSSSFFEDSSSGNKAIPCISQNTPDIGALVSTADSSTLQLVLDCTPERLRQYVDILLERRARFAVKIQQMLLDGQKIEAFAKECDVLHDELQSFDEIIKLKAEYQTASQERTRARINIGIAAESEQSTKLYVQQSKKANRKCQNIMTIVLDLLKPISAEFKSDLSNDECQLVAPGKIEDKLRGIIVKSTQVDPVRQRLSRRLPWESLDKSIPSQYVMQTPQVPNDGIIGHHDNHYNVQKGQQPLCSRLNSPSEEHQFQSNVYLHSRDVPEPRTKSRSLRKAHDEFDEFYDGEEDDADYLAAVEQAESHRKASPLIGTSGRRHILQPITSNPERIPTSMTAIGKPLSLPKASDLQHPWSKDLMTKLHDSFKMKGFRENQLEAINSTLAGNDTFVLMPTGGGKSLCYQLPAILRSGKTQGVTIVISPLLSLMEDQVDHLKKLQIQALHISADVSKEQKNFIMQGLRDPDPQKLIQLLYVTPEMINKNLYFIDRLCDLNQRQRLARIVIDEAHCVSQWGHDFRPDYKTLGTLRAQHFPNVPVLALTATATEMVKTDVQHNLGMKNCKVFSQSFNRPNLTYEICDKPGTGSKLVQEIVSIIRTKHNRQAGIIYCFSRKNCEDLASKLHEEGNIQAAHYHAGMSPEERSTTQKRWQSGQIKIIVATIAFGMGIDKPDVRFVIHQSVPWTLEGYYQETGRAGRDGKLSHCYLYFSSKDIVKLKRMLFSDKEIPQGQKERKLEMLKKIEQFCQNHSDCRRSRILNYFNERFTKEQCNGTCDNCWNKYETEIRDYTDIAAAAVKLVLDAQSNLDKGISIINCIDAFIGTKGGGQNLSHLKYFGHGKNLKRDEAARIFYHLLLEDAIQEKQEMNRAGFPHETVMLGRKYQQFAERKIPVKLEFVLSKEKANANPPKKESRTRLPWSTAVPSPLRKGQRVQHKNDDSDSDNLGARRSGYRDDGFVVEDDDKEDEDYFDIQEDNEPKYPPAQSTSAFYHKDRKKLGLPITTDKQLNQLDELHLDIVEGFVSEATKLGKKVDHQFL